MIRTRTVVSPIEDTGVAVRRDRQEVIAGSRPGAAVEVPVAACAGLVHVAHDGNVVPTFGLVSTL